MPSEVTTSSVYLCVILTSSWIHLCSQQSIQLRIQRLHWWENGTQAFLRSSRRTNWRERRECCRRMWCTICYHVGLRGWACAVRQIGRAQLHPLVLRAVRKRWRPALRGIHASAASYWWRIEYIGWRRQQEWKTERTVERWMRLNWAVFRHSWYHRAVKYCRRCKCFIGRHVSVSMYQFFHYFTAKTKKQ